VDHGHRESKGGVLCPCVANGGMSEMQHVQRRGQRRAAVPTDMRWMRSCDQDRGLMPAMPDLKIQTLEVLHHLHGFLVVAG